METRTKPINHSAGGWTSLFDGGRRRPALPLPVHRPVEQSAWSIRQMPIGCVILEEIMQYTLSNLHIIQKSLRYWESRARGSNSQQVYFMMLERGPRAFAEAARQSLARLMGSGGGPSQSILGSAKGMISRNIDALTRMERFFASFLAELYRRADICREELTGSRDQSLHALFIVLNHVFMKLEELLREDGRNPSVFHFERLPDVVGTESLQCTEELSTRGIPLIYQNLEDLDNLVSSQLSSCKKPGNMTIYWLPYTCGAIGLSACSMWLLRHSSLMGSPHVANWIGHAKESLAGFRNGKPTCSVADELSERRFSTAKEEAILEHDQVVKSSRLNFQAEILELDQVDKANRLDLQKVILQLGPILEATKFSFALLALGLSLRLLLSAGARVMQAQHAEGRSRIAQRLVAAEEKLVDFQECNVVGGKENEACWKFGLALYSLDRLYQAVELYTNGRTEAWSNRFKEHVFYLAKPGLNEEDQRAVLSGLKDMCDRLFP